MRYALLFNISLMLCIATSTTLAHPVYCMQVYKPVCGKDGRTYANLCKLNVAKVGKAHDGACGAKR